MVVGHNALDGVSFADGSAADVVWSFLHVRKMYRMAGGRSFLVLYPLLGRIKRASASPSSRS